MGPPKQCSAEKEEEEEREKEREREREREREGGGRKSSGRPHYLTRFSLSTESRRVLLLLVGRTGGGEQEN
jgi:hypothetical protein